MSLPRRVAHTINQYEFWLLWVYGLPLLFSSSLPLPIFAATLTTIPLFWLARRAVRGSFSVSTPLDLSIVILLCLGVLGIIVSTDKMTSLRLYLEFVGVVALYYAVVNSRASSSVEPWMWVLLLLGCAMGILGALGLRSSEKFLPTTLFSLLPSPDLSFFNSRGFEPNIVAGSIAPVVPVIAAWSFTQTRPRRAFLLSIVFFLLCVVILTQSRGALIGIMIALGLLLLWRIPHQLRLVALAGALGIGVLVLFGPANLAEVMLVADSTNTAAGRLELWDRALQMMRDFPFTGIGPGNFEKTARVLYPLFINDTNYPLPHSHNLYLQIGVDYGIGGFVAFVGLAATAVLVGLLNVRRASVMPRGWIAVGLLTGYLAYLLHGLLDGVAISTKVNVVIWFILGLMMLVERQPEEPKHDLESLR